VSGGMGNSGGCMDLQSSQFSPRHSGDSWMSLEHGTSASTPAQYTNMWKTLVSDAIKNNAAGADC